MHSPLFKSLAPLPAALLTLLCIVALAASQLVVQTDDPTTSADFELKYVNGTRECAVAAVRERERL
jgi:hypothetical protein